MSQLDPLQLPGHPATTHSLRVICSRQHTGTCCSTSGRAKTEEFIMLLPLKQVTW